MNNIGPRLKFTSLIPERRGSMPGDVTLVAAFRGPSNDPKKDLVIGVRLDRGQVKEIVTSGNPSQQVSPYQAKLAQDAFEAHQG